MLTSGISSLNKIFFSIAFSIIGMASCASTEKNTDEFSTAGNDEAFFVFSDVINPQIPAEIEFAGQKYTFNRTDLYERFDRELASVTYTHGATLLLMKRANKYFPVLAPILKKNNIPIDFLYLACIESSLNQRALSPAKAAGFWQFMPQTARDFGLEVNDFVDERYNIAKSTEAACRYLKKAYSDYGNWESVAASYNAGMTRISRELDQQQQKSALDLYLNDETSRYMFRIFATKLILENPQDYGFFLEPEQLYFPTPTRTIEVSAPIADLAQWAKSKGSSYQWLKELNPWLRSKSLPNKTGKTYRILLPADNNAIDRSKIEKPIFNIDDFR